MNAIRIAQTWVLLVLVELAMSCPIPVHASEVETAIRPMDYDGKWFGWLASEVYGHTAIYDPLRDRMLALGGIFHPTSDVWTLSISGDHTWNALAVSGNPPPARGAHTAIYDPVRDRMIVFGGRSSGSYRNDVWALNLSGTPSWTELIPTGTLPPGRESHSAIYDSGQDRMVVFGGRNGSGRLNDAWSLTLSGPPAWSPLSPAGVAPSARFGHTACVDQGRDRMLVFGGFDGAYRNDVWELTLSGTETWHALSPSGSPPAERHSHTAIYDSNGDRMVVFGGFDSSPLARNDVWALSLSGAGTWNELSPPDTTPPVREDHTAIYDPVRNRMVVFGGFDGYTQYLNDVWALTLSGSPKWTALSISTVRPPGMTKHSVIYDPLRQRMIAYGNGELWALTLSGTPTWSPMSASGTPPPVLSGHSAIYDPVRDRMVVLGGYYATSAGSETWALTLSGTPTWVKVNSDNLAPFSHYDGHSAIYDPVRDRMVVFYYPFQGNPAIWALSFSGTPHWSSFNPSGTRPPGREGQFAFYDPVLDRMVVFGGNVFGQTKNDVWALSFSGNEWTELSPSGTPPAPLAYPTAIYDATAQRMIVFGGSPTNAHSDVWELALSGTPTWREMAPLGGPTSGRSGAKAIFDRLNDRMILFGGKVDVLTYASDLWALSWRQEANDVAGPMAPSRLLLHPVRPNPSRSAIELSYELSTDQYINLDVLDVQGRLIRRLRNGIQPAGVHRMTFNGRDDRGSRLAAGVYLVRLGSRAEARVARIVVLP